MNRIDQNVEMDESKIKEYVKRILSLESEIASLKQDIKIVKQEAKEEGLLVKEIDKAIAEIKREIKKNSDPAQREIVKDLTNLLEKDDDIYHTIHSLIENQ